MQSPQGARVMRNLLSFNGRMQSLAARVIYIPYYLIEDEAKSLENQFAQI